METCLQQSTIEKETYEIMPIITFMLWLRASRRRLNLYTGHNNPVFLFNPLSTTTNLSQTTLQKVLRWSIFLSAHTNIYVHVPETYNLWAGLLSRWTDKKVLPRLFSAPLLTSSSSKDFEWQTIDSFLVSRRKNSANRKADLGQHLDKI